MAKENNVNVVEKNVRIFHGDMSEGRHCHVDLEAPHKEIETGKHSLLVEACGWGPLSPTGERA